MYRWPDSLLDVCGDKATQTRKDVEYASPGLFNRGPCPSRGSRPSPRDLPQVSYFSLHGPKAPAKMGLRVAQLIISNLEKVFTDTAGEILTGLYS